MSSWLNELLEIKNNETKTINDPFLRFSLTEPEWYDYMLNLYSTPETREYKQEYFRMVYHNTDTSIITAYMLKYNLARAKQNPPKRLV